MNVQDRCEWEPNLGSRLASSYEHVGAGVVEVGRDGRMLRVNRQFCELTGFLQSELLGRSIFQVTLPEDVDADQAQFNRQIGGEIDRYTIEKRLWKKDGSHFWAEVTSSSVRGADGEF